MWLLEQETFRELQRARLAGLVPNAEQQRELDASALPIASSRRPSNMRIAGDAAEIRIEGVLTKKPDFIARFFLGGNATYSDIQTALEIAQSDPNVKRVRLFIDSPGGNVDGLFDTLAAIESLKSRKPVTVRAANAQSAAFGIAALAGKIEATNVAAMFGSVGVAVSLFVDDDIVTLTNTDSPDKRPDVATKDGQAVVRRHLDAIHELFIDAIARGRGTSAKNVTENFGRGATLLARDAKRLGMIDSVAMPAVSQLALVESALARMNERRPGESNQQLANRIAREVFGNAPPSTDISARQPSEIGLPTVGVANDEAFAEQVVDELERRDGIQR